MLKGDLTSTPLAPLLLELADDTATGCLVITDSTEDEALVYFKQGLVYSVSVPGSRPQLGAKLVSSGALAPEALSEALEAQRTELQGWRLGELLVHLGYVDQPVVEAFVAEQVSEALWDLLRWSDGRWRFRKNVKAREDVGPPMAIVDLLETLRERGYVWEMISAVVHGPGAIPRLSTRGDTSNETTLDNDAWSMLCKIDGERSVAQLAADCGYTLFEAGHVIVSLVQAGLVDIDEEIDIEGSALYGATTLSSALAGDLDEATFTPAETDDEDALAKLARLVTEVAGTGEATEDGAAAAAVAEAAPVAPAQRRDNELESAMTVSVNRHSGESFAASIARVSGALSEVLGEVPPPDIDTAELAARRRRAAPSTDDPEWQRRKRLRSAAAAELASAQALIETLRPDRDGAPTTTTPEFTGDVPKVLSRATERSRAAARDAEEAERHAAEESARESAEQFARAAAEEADRVAAEQDAARVAAEQAAADEAARLEAEAAEAAARVEAEQATAAAAAEAAAQAAAEAEAAAETDRVQAERAAAEEAAWAEYWHLEEAERAAAEAAEHAAAAEAEAERVAAAQAEAQAAEEAERIAAEEAAREAEAQAAARAEFERIAADEAARQAEADRIAAEQAAAQAEADRLAAEAAAQQAAAQAEADRLAAEAAAQQAAAEAEAAAAAAKADAAARRKAEKAAAAEAAQREDEAAAAAALLAEFAASSAPDEPEAAAEPEYNPAPEEHAEAEVREPVAVGGGWSDADTTDTAALLRELSSLGGDDDRDAPSGPTTPSRPRPNAPDKKVKKKIGLFGL